MAAVRPGRGTATTSSRNSIMIRLHFIGAHENNQFHQGMKEDYEFET